SIERLAHSVEVIENSRDRCGRLDAGDDAKLSCCHRTYEADPFRTKLLTRLCLTWADRLVGRPDACRGGDHGDTHTVPTGRIFAFDRENARASGRKPRPARPRRGGSAVQSDQNDNSPWGGARLGAATVVLLAKPQNRFLRRGIQG